MAGCGACRGLGGRGRNGFSVRVRADAVRRRQSVRRRRDGEGRIEERKGAWGRRGGCLGPDAPDAQDAEKSSCGQRGGTDEARQNAPKRRGPVLFPHGGVPLPSPILCALPKFTASENTPIRYHIKKSAGVSTSLLSIISTPNVSKICASAI